MINILQVLPTLGYGGVAKVVDNYYDVIDHKHYHFDFVTHGGVEDYHARLIADGSKIFYFKTIGKIGSKNYCKQILNAIDLDKYDIIHIHTGAITGLYAKNYKKCGAKKIICHAHTTRAVSRYQKVFEKLFRKMALDYSDMTMACGYEAGDYCFGKNQYILLPNSINYDSFNSVSADQITRVRNELKIGEDAFIIGHIGHFSPQKNHFFLLEYAQEYIKKHPETIFILCGDGPRFNEVKGRVTAAGMANNIILTGIRNDINVLMHIFDVFVLPSLHEGLPVVGIEAQTAGLQCLLSDQIDHRVDIGCNLCRFIPISDGCGVWVKATEEIQKKSTRVNSEDIRLALKNHNYDITSTRNILMKAYNNLSGKSF